MVLCIPTWRHLRHHFQSYSSFSNREPVARTSVMTTCQKNAGALNLFQGKWCHQDQVTPQRPTQPILCQTNCTHFALIYIHTFPQTSVDSQNNSGGVANSFQMFAIYVDAKTDTLTVSLFATETLIPLPLFSFIPQKSINHCRQSVFRYVWVKGSSTSLSVQNAPLKWTINSFGAIMEDVPRIASDAVVAI